MKKPKRRTRKLLLASLVFALVSATIAVVDYWAYPFGAAMGGRSYNTGENGLWMRYSWYFGDHNAADFRELAARLKAQQIKYAYFHVRSVNKTGELSYHKPAQAKALIGAVHRLAHGTKALAWIYCSTGPYGPTISDSNTRKAMVAEAVWLVHSCGFDGVQWDVEPCPDGDPGFAALLADTRAALPRGKLLSVAAPMWQPGPMMRFGWSDAYFTQIASSCDQIAVMCYDSGYYMPRAYVWLVRQQAIHVPRAVARAKSSCKVLLGLPTYRDGLRSHNPRAENLTNALRGVREGLSDPAADTSAFAGIAPFADYTTRESDWRVYDELWLGR